MDERRTDTRTNIREVALELFAEQGYDKTSLREIAERLGITKAAVYYHYKTKEDIFTSLFDDLLGGLDGIIEWGRSQPRGVATREGLLRRYADLLTSGPTAQLVRFTQESHTSVREHAATGDMKKRFDELTGLLVDPGASTLERMRVRLSVVALHLGAFVSDDEHGSIDERRTAALSLALELAGVGSGSADSQR